jgi:dTMP kinase
VYDVYKGDTMAGLFITFEGPDGAGKTTQLRLLADKLTKRKHQVLCTREPGGTRISDKIREMLLDPANREMDSRAEALLYAAARAQHVAEIIRPALLENRIVLCDRFADSSLAYQGWGRGLNINALCEISNFASDSLQPDMTVLLDVEPEIGNIRMSIRCGEERDRIEQEHDVFRDRVCQGFRELARIHVARIVHIDANKSIPEIHKEIWTQIERLLAKPREGRTGED